MAPNIFTAIKERCEIRRGRKSTSRSLCESTMSHVFVLIKKFGHKINIEDLHTKVFISGSSINSILNDLPFADFDIFFYKEEHLKEFKNNVSGFNADSLYVTETLVNILLEGRELQFVLLEAGKPEDVAKNFDWSVGSASAVFNETTGEPDIQYYEEYKDISGIGLGNKPYSSFMRLIKYLKRGWRFDDEQEQISFIDKIIIHALDSQEELRESGRNLSKDETLKIIRDRDPGYYSGRPRYK
jgi:hypothetical protein